VTKRFVNHSLVGPPFRCYTSVDVVTPSTKKQTAFRLDPEILDGLLFVKDRDGIPLSEQVRRALRTWLDQKGVRLSVTTRKQQREKRR
jgi:hypothetical protein